MSNSLRRDALRHWANINGWTLDFESMTAANLVSTYPIKINTDKKQVSMKLCGKWYKVAGSEEMFEAYMHWAAEKELLGETDSQFVNKK